MKLRDYLSIPYLLEACSIERAPDIWTRHVSYPELPGCSAEADELETAIEHLERARIRTLLRMLHAGLTPAVPRPPLTNCDPAGLARELGIESEIAGLLDLDETNLRRSTSAA